MSETSVYVPANPWQPSGMSHIETMRANGTLARWYYALPEDQKLALKWCWRAWARPTQLAPPDDLDLTTTSDPWKYWVLLAGRGFGKTRTAAEHIRDVVVSRKAKRIALIGPTYRDVIQTMIEGESGLLSVFPQGGSIRPRLVKNTVRFECKGERIAEGFIYTGEEPERLRGPQHDYAWIDEFAAMLKIEQVWLMFVAGHRLGPWPRAVITTTPKSTLLRVNLLQLDGTVVTFGKSQDNRTNLAPGTVDNLENIYEDTDFADQELGGVLRLEDSGNLFRMSWFDAHRAQGTIKGDGSIWSIHLANGKKLAVTKVAVAVDPSGSSKSTACETGIVLTAYCDDGNAYAFEDLSKRCAPEEWGSLAARAAHRFGSIGGVVAEANFGGDMVTSVIKNAAREAGFSVRVTPVTAETSKVHRAMKVSPLAQKGRLRILGRLSKLEKQATQWSPGDGQSPDRLDALVWGATALLLKAPPRQGIAAPFP